MELFGVHFPIGEFVDVHDPDAIKILLGNNAFESRENPTKNLPEQIESVPHSDGGRDALLREAQDLSLDVDGRWGAERLRQAIREYKDND